MEKMSLQAKLLQEDWMFRTPFKAYDLNML